MDYVHFNVHDAKMDARQLSQLGRNQIAHCFDGLMQLLVNCSASKLPSLFMGIPAFCR